MIGLNIILRTFAVFAFACMVIGAVGIICYISAFLGVIILRCLKWFEEKYKGGTEQWEPMIIR